VFLLVDGDLEKSTVVVGNIDLRSELKLQLVCVESGKHAKVHFD